jgi:hypothetical protein
MHEPKNLFILQTYTHKCVWSSPFQHSLRINATTLDCISQCSMLLPRPFGKGPFLLLTFIKSVELLVCFLWLKVVIFFIFPVMQNILNSTVSELFFPSYLVISSNYQTCLGLLMHYPLIGDVHSLILKALFLRDPKVRICAISDWGEK